MHGLKLFIFFMLVVINAIVSGTSLAMTYHVDINDPNANDNNPGSAAKPWRTLTKAGNTAQGGDTVLVKAGIYNKVLRPVNSGSAGNLITFKSYTEHSAVLDGAGAFTSGVDLSYGGGRKYIRIEGFEIRNWPGEGIYLQDFYNTGVEGVEVVGNDIHHNGENGIRVSRATDCLIENNKIHDNGTSHTGSG
ncbi:MAG: right-handed parallel beta-helix repeat-containing protein, partial [Planctomycetota bacterium]